MRHLDELRTPSDGLWSPMSLDQSLELVKIMRRYEERTLRVLTRHMHLRGKRDHHYAQAMLFLEQVIQRFLFLGKVLVLLALPAKGASYL